MYHPLHNLSFNTKLTNTSSRSVEQLINSNTTKANEHENIPNIILKNCAKELGICELFQHSTDSGELQKDWIHANVTPVFKKGDKHLAENYRPLSI